MREGLKTAGRLAEAVGRAAVEAIFPAKCLACGEFIETCTKKPDPHSKVRQRAAEPLAAFVCRSCMMGIHPVVSPICESCGVVFASRAGTDHICEDCIRAPNYFQQARSALIYTDPCAHLVHAFKYNGKIQLARPLGDILKNAFDRFWTADAFDLIVPVPLHRRKLRQRGFNQVWLMMRQWALLERGAPGRKAAAAFDCNLLARMLSTRPQTGLGRKERPVNLRNAFGIAGEHSVAGLRMLVVDDVYTTGATANECARTLCQHGAERVDVLTLARAV